MRVTPDGRHVVVAAAEGVTVLARDAATGASRHLRGRGTCATIHGTDGLGMGRAGPRERLDGD